MMDPMIVFLNAWAGILTIITMFLTALSAPLVVVGTIIACIAVEDAVLWPKAQERPQPREWLRRARIKWLTLIIFVGFILLNATFFLYAYYPWGPGLWNVFRGGIS